MTVMDRLAVSVDEAAKMIGISRAAMYPLIMGGDIPSFTVGTRRLIPLAELKEWMNRQSASAI